MTCNAATWRKAAHEIRMNWLESEGLSFDVIVAIIVTVVLISQGSW